MVKGFEIIENGKFTIIKYGKDFIEVPNNRLLDLIELLKDYERWIRNV